MWFNAGMNKGKRFHSSVEVVYVISTTEIADLFLAAVRGKYNFGIAIAARLQCHLHKSQQRVFFKKYFHLSSFTLQYGL